MGKERGDKKGKRHTKSSGKWRNQMNFGKTESLDTPKSVGEKKMRRGEGGEASGQKWHTKGKWLVSSQFF